MVVLGQSFKEDCPDPRNSTVADVVRELEDYGCRVSEHDPVGDILSKLKPDGVFVDVKSTYDPEVVRSKGVRLWRL